MVTVAQEGKPPNEGLSKGTVKLSLFTIGQILNFHGFLIVGEAAQKCTNNIHNLLFGYCTAISPAQKSCIRDKTPILLSTFHPSFCLCTYIVQRPAERLVNVF